MQLLLFQKFCAASSMNLWVLLLLCFFWNPVDIITIIVVANPRSLLSQILICCTKIIFIYWYITHFIRWFVTGKASFSTSSLFWTCVLWGCCLQQFEWPYTIAILVGRCFLTNFAYRLGQVVKLLFSIAQM